MTKKESGGSAQQGTSRTRDFFASRLKQLRRLRGMTAQQLVERCTELGAPTVTANVIANIETRRRDVSVDELLIFAAALDVAPVHLLSPPHDQQVRLRLTPSLVVEDGETLRRWLRGDSALPSFSARHYLEYAMAHAPGVADDNALTEYAHAVLQEGAKRLVTQYEAEATQFVGNVRDQLDDVLANLEHSVQDGVRGPDLLRVLGDLRRNLSEGPADSVALNRAESDG